MEEIKKEQKDYISLANDYLQSGQHPFSLNWRELKDLHMTFREIGGYPRRTKRGLHVNHQWICEMNLHGHLLSAQATNKKDAETAVARQFVEKYCPPTQ